MEQYDAILCPIEIDVALPHGNVNDVDKHMNWAHMSAYNLTGWPTAAIRVGTANGTLPVGLQVVGQPWKEDVVLALALQIEKISGGFKPPDLQELAK